MLHPQFYPFPNITTSRLLLREVVALDALRLFTLRSNNEVMRFIEHNRAKSIHDIHQLIAKIDTQQANGTGINWAITLQGSDELIGTVCLFNIQNEHYRAELGYLLDPNFHGKGIMIEAVTAIIQYGFNTLGLHSMEAHINPENVASQKVLERVGFVQEGLFKENFFCGGEFTDTAIYSLLKS